MEEQHSLLVTFSWWERDSQDGKWSRVYLMRRVPRRKKKEAQARAIENYFLHIATARLQKGHIALLTGQSAMYAGGTGKYSVPIGT